MTKSAKPALAEGKIHSVESSTSRHFLVGDFLLPSNFKNTKTSYVKGVDFLFLHTGQNPYFATL